MQNVQAPPQRNPSILLTGTLPNPVSEETPKKDIEMNTLNLLQAIFALVKLIEAAMPTSSGTEKFDAVLNKLNEDAGTAVSNVPLITTFITGAVNVLNLLGVFKKTVKAA